MQLPGSTATSEMFVSKAAACATAAFAPGLAAQGCTQSVCTGQGFVFRTLSDFYNWDNDFLGDETFVYSFASEEINTFNKNVFPSEIWSCLTL